MTDKRKDFANESRHPELVLSQADAKTKLSQKTRRGLLTGAVAALAGVGAYKWVTGSAAEDEAPWPERRILDANGRLFHATLSDSRRTAEFAADRIGGVKPNGNVGIDTPLDVSSWEMMVTSDEASQQWKPTLAEIKAMPRTEMTTRFCCIEGWSGISQWTGVRFSDFTKAYPGTSTNLPSYVYMATPDEAYYVGLDTKSAMHPQTLLAYEQNGKPLEERRGAPLRLVIPVKYGIKNLKRIGQIKYTNQKPDDYWAEEGYDWFAGL